MKRRQRELPEIGSVPLDELVRSKAFYDHYRNEVGKRILYEAQLHDPIDVEYLGTPEQLDAIMRHIEGVWTRLGETDAHWSVVSTRDFRADRINDTIDQFHNTGKAEVANLARLMKRVGLDTSQLHSALEYGCGVGRVTRWLAEMFPHVTGVDISSPHLTLANEYFAKEGKRNIDTLRVQSLSDIDNLPEFDFLYSKIVLQHNPPPVIYRVFSSLCTKLRPGGVGVVQIPTYCRNYSFAVDAYLRTAKGEGEMEMHALPQRAVFDVLSKANCSVVEVFRDHLVNGVDFVSSTFVFAKDRDV